MNPLIVTENFNGGAGMAARRLVNVLAIYGENVKTITSDFNKNSLSGNRVIRSIKVRLASKYLGFQRSKNVFPRSINIFSSPSRLLREINEGGWDVVNLHWVNAEMMSIRDIGKIQKPVVWTLHDMWPFCGAEHYAEDSADARWRSGYWRSNRYQGDSGIDLDRQTWTRKRHLWKRKWHLVSPSKWLLDSARSSELMRDWPGSVIPNPLDLETFRPWPKEIARMMCRLPSIDVPLVLFGSLGGDRDGRKGQDLLLEAMSHLDKIITDKPEIVIFGQDALEHLSDFPFKIHWMGRFHDEISMALLYSSANLMVVPSRLDNLPQTGTEAQACGCPVVAFRVGGLPDVVDHGRTGYLAEPFETQDLANGIAWILLDANRQAELSAAARNRACDIWNRRKVFDAYMATYQEAIEAQMEIR